MANNRIQYQCFYTNCRLKIDHDLNSSVDDISKPHKTRKNKFLYQEQQNIQNNDGRNVVSAKKFNTYYPKILPCK